MALTKDGDLSGFNAKALALSPGRNGMGLSGAERTGVISNPENKHLD